MTERDTAQLERLRAAFAAGPVTPAPGTCPEPDRLWAAARGELEPGPMREVIGHLAACRACADDWWVAVELAKSGAARGQAPAAAAPAPWWRRAPALAAAAAVVLVAVGLLRVIGPSGYRGDDRPALRSLVPPAAALPRDAARLRWELAPAVAGARFDVRVTSADLAVLAEASDLAAPELLVPREALAALPPGARIYWRVGATLPDGGRLRSPTFTARLE